MSSADLSFKRSVFSNYSSSIFLLGSILIGALAGIILKERAAILKPLGDIFLNLLFTSVVPLVFFSISSSVAGMNDLKKLGRVLFWMMAFFIATGIVSSVLMIAAVKTYPPVIGTIPSLPQLIQTSSTESASKIVETFTVSDFAELLSKQHMLALILFSMLVGLASASLGEKGKLFSDFLVSGSEVMGKVIKLIMLYAPIGLAAYFAYLTGVFGPELMGSYLRAVTLYYPVSLLYFLISNSAYTYWAGGAEGFKRFWSRIAPASLTALGTGSSIATIPSNLEAADRIGIPKEVSRVVIPLGATIHMDGTCLSAILKISILFSFFHLPFSGLGTYATAVGIALLSGIVMSGIPGGGFLGELLIVTLYGFPREALPIISMIGTLVDPPATMVNAIGDNSVSMLVARKLRGKNCLNEKSDAE